MKIIQINIYFNIVFLVSCGKEKIEPQTDHTFNLVTPDSSAFNDTCLVPRMVNDLDVYGCARMNFKELNTDFIPYFGLIDSSVLGGLISMYLFKEEILKEKLVLQFFPLEEGIYTKLTSVPWSLKQLGSRTTVDFFSMNSDQVKGRYVLDTFKLNFIKVNNFNWSTQIVKARFKFYFYLLNQADKIKYPELQDSIFIDDGIIYGTFLK